MKQELLTSRELNTYHTLQKTITIMSEKRKKLARRLKYVDMGLETLIEVKWKLERKMTPIKVIPTRKEGTKSPKKLTLNKKGRKSPKIDPIILAELARLRMGVK